MRRDIHIATLIKQLQLLQVKFFHVSYQQQNEDDDDDITTTSSRLKFASLGTFDVFSVCACTLTSHLLVSGWTTFCLQNRSKGSTRCWKRILTLLSKCWSKKQGSDYAAFSQYIIIQSWWACVSWSLGFFFFFFADLVWFSAAVAHLLQAVLHLEMLFCNPWL